MKPVAFDPEADEELVLAAAWYERRREGFAEAFLHQVKRTMNRIIQNPQWFPMIDAPSRSVVRRAPVSRFPYSVVYCELADEIRVLAVPHSKRQPGYWFERIQ
jgi:toxin ParE1/3/4